MPTGLISRQTANGIIIDLTKSHYKSPVILEGLGNTFN